MITVVVLYVVAVVTSILLQPRPTPQTIQVSPSYTMDQVAQHRAPSDCWTAVNGKVVDVTAFINKHPGGDKAILSLCGTDGSAAFNKQHGGQEKPEAALESFVIGSLKK